MARGLGALRIIVDYHRARRVAEQVFRIGDLRAIRLSDRATGDLERLVSVLDLVMGSMSMEGYPDLTECLWAECIKGHKDITADIARYE